MSQEKFVFINCLTDDNKVKLPIYINTTVEEIIITVCQRLNIGPIARHLFSLRFNKQIRPTLWVGLNCKLWDLSYNHFDFRLRFRVPSLKRLNSVDINAFNYYFLQVKDDVNNGRITDISHDKHKEELVGLGVTDMFRELVEKNVSEDIVLNEYAKYMPKEVLKHHWFFVKKPIHKALTEIQKNGNRDSTRVKISYLDQVEQMAPNYLAESYEAQIDEEGDAKDIIIRVNPLDKEMPGVQYHYAGKKEMNHICSIEDLCFISIHSNGTMELSRKTGIPLYMQFQSTLSMISLVSLLDGYYRLTTKWTFNLCKDVSTPSLERLQSFKCHGPVGGEFSYAKLAQKRNNKPGCFIIRESETAYNVYYIDVCTKGRKPTTYKVEYRGGGHYWFEGNEESYKSIPALINALKNETCGNIPCLTECIPSSEYDESILLLCRLEDFNSKKTDVNKNSGGDSLSGPPQCIHARHLQVYQGKMYGGKRGFTEVTKCIWRRENLCKTDVALKVLKPSYCDSNLKDFLSLINDWALLRSSSVSRLLGVKLGSPIGMVTEWQSLGPLDVYLQENEASLKDVDLVEAATYLANALWHLEENSVVHGYIRCHKLLVAAHTDTTFSVCLSDPGLQSEYTTEDVHWIPPEFYDFMEVAKRSQTADIWAFGTTLWQIFSFGTLPRIPCVMDVKEFYRRGERLPRPHKCPNDVFRLIVECWQADPHRRKRPQAALRDINKLLYQVFNSRRLLHSYATAKPRRCSSKDTLYDVSSTALDESSDQFISNQFSNSSNDLIHFNSELPTALCSTYGSAELLVPINMDMSYNQNFSTSTTSLGSESILELFQGENIVLQGKIGQGFYGDVYKGIIEPASGSTSGQELVAVKKLRTSSVSFVMADFEKEISIMKMLKHPNIVAMKAGIQEPEVTLVMEYVKHGSLFSYLRIKKDTLDPKIHFLKYALDIAEGMKYLGEKKIVHRDLAARNILVADEFLVKISDFGLAQFTDQNNYYILKTDRELPFRWHSPESLRHGKFSSSSDVWSYGVTLFEMFSYGKEPIIDYKESAQDPLDLLEALEKGHRLPFPEKCPGEVHCHLISPCWKLLAKDRPSFAEIITIIKNLRN